MLVTTRYDDDDDAVFLLHPYTAPLTEQLTHGAAHPLPYYASLLILERMIMHFLLVVPTCCRDAWSAF